MSITDSFTFASFCCANMSQHVYANRLGNRLEKDLFRESNCGHPGFLVKVSTSVQLYQSELGPRPYEGNCPYGVKNSLKLSGPDENPKNPAGTCGHFMAQLSKYLRSC